MLTESFLIPTAPQTSLFNPFQTPAGQNYARYLTYFSMFMLNLETTHPGATELIKGGAFSAAWSFIPGNRTAVDKTIEETIVKYAKSRGGSGSTDAGLTGLQTNYGAYQRWV